MSDLEDELVARIRAAGLPRPEREVRFDPVRRWRFDLAWPEIRLAAEVDGGIWARGYHVRGRGYEADCEKQNAAGIAGWTVLRFTADMVRDGQAVETLRLALAGADAKEKDR